MKRLLGVLAMATVGAGASAAEPTDPAALFPAGVLLYAEVGNPADTSAALSKYLKDTVLADTLAFSHDRRDKLSQPQQLPGFTRSQLIGLLTAPEMLTEMKRVRGAAVAVTGFDAKSGKPQWVAAVLLGDSHAIGLQFRTYLTLSPNIRRVGKVDGVPIYQNRGLTGGTFDDQGMPKAAADPVPAEGASEPTYLYVPGLFVVGSGKAAVLSVYKRFTGKDTSASFAASGQLKKAAAQRTKAGAFLFADTAGVLGNPAGLRALLPAEIPADLVAAAVRFLLDPKSVPAITGNLVIEPDGVGLVLTGDVEPEAESPLHAIASGAALEPAAIRHSPDAVAAFTLGFPAKDKRAKALLAVADALATAAGRVGASPTERVAEAKAKGFKLEEDLLPRVTAATVFQPAKLDRPKGVPEWPLVALRFESDADAGHWETEFPKLAGLLAGAEKAPDVSRETVGGVRVSAVVVTVDGQKVPVHYARLADRLVIGVDQKRVAAVTKDGGKPPVVPAATKEFAASGFGFVRLAGLLPPPVKKQAIDPTPRPLVEPPAPPGVSRIEDLLPIQPSQPPVPPVAEVSEPFRDAVKGLAPLTLTLGTKGNTLRVELWHRDIKKALSTAFEQGMLWLEQRTGTNPGQHGPGGLNPYLERDGPLMIDR